MTRALTALLVLPLVLVALAGCGSSSSSSSSSSGTSAPQTAGSTATSPPASGGASASGAVAVAIVNLAFSPATIHAKVGQTVQWTNQDAPAHTVTYLSGPTFRSSGTLNTGNKYTVKLTRPGTIHYMCTIHPFMKATIVVSK